MRDFFKGVLAFFLLVFLIIGGIVGYFYTTLMAPAENHEEHVVVIPAGYSAKGIINILGREGIIKNPTTSYFYYRLFGDDYNFIAGTYVFNGKMSTMKAFDYISNGANLVQDTVRITFVEGEFLTQMAEKIAAVTNLTEDQLLVYWQNDTSYQDLMRSYSVLTNQVLNNPSIKYKFEGYLSPNTYDFFTYTTCEQVTRKMLDETQRIYEKYQKDFEKSEFSINEIFTLASIVELEGGTADDMAIISGIFQNRLKINQMLESSATVCYALGEKSHKCELASANAQTASDPYNTYHNFGLTPGPICAPSEYAIEVALHPKKTNYYFFFAKDGKVYYSQTYEQHCKLGGC